MDLSEQNEPLFLDANASMPIIREAKEAFSNTVDLPGNASSPHFMGRRLRVILDEARQSVAKALGGEEKQVFFTSGASEGNRWVVSAIVLAGQMRGRPLKVTASPLEHPSLLKPLQVAHLAGQIELTLLPIYGGKLAFDGVENAEVVIVTAAHNETGYIPDWESIIKRASSNAILIADVAQAVARLDPLPKRVDILVCSAHKMGGITGSGAVLLRGNGRKLPAPWAGGGQEAGLRPGSEAVALIAAFGAAAACIERTRQEHVKLAAIRDELEEELLRAWSFATVIGKGQPRISNTSAIVLNGVDGEALRIATDVAGLMIGFGSACSALAPEPSPGLMAFGLTSPQAKATIRISLPSDIALNILLEAKRRLILVP